MVTLLGFRHGASEHTTIENPRRRFTDFGLVRDQ